MKPVSVSETSAVDEGDAPLGLEVEEPLIVLSFARALVLAQEANGGGAWRDARLLAVVFGIKVVPACNVRHFNKGRFLYFSIEH